mmetsp:Transcript_1256/g.1795  ORF Transcript_1256/g.1795 Transcript_1256/m.1795 type:complete len:302 (+) Transcript_1256:210-1115(+)
MATPKERSAEALCHLKKLRPLDEWSTDNYIDSNGSIKLTLKRRNIAVADEGFLEIMLDDKSGCVVGIKSRLDDKKSNFSMGRAVVLVDNDGNISSGKGREIRITIPNKSKRRQEVYNDARMNSRTIIEKAKAAIRRKDADGLVEATGDAFEELSNQQNSELVKIGIYFIAGAVFLKALTNIFFSVYLIALPILVLYAMQTCPSNDSFDTKKELKRVLRGEYLPENHPDKPKDWFSKTVAKVGASVGAELSTGLGYKINMNTCFGLFTFVHVHLPLAKQDLYWIGVFGRWRYLMQREEPNDK